MSERRDILVFLGTVRVFHKEHERDYAMPLGSELRLRLDRVERRYFTSSISLP